MIAIDLGSNTLRVVKYDCQNKKRVSEYEKIVRTAQNLHIDNTIDQHTVENIIKAIEESKCIVEYNSNNTIKAVTTEALRVATNSQDVIDKIYQTTGVKFDIIDGDTEANLVLIAIKNAINSLNINTNNFVVVDIGGGSTEVTFCNQNDIVSKSFRVGIVTLTNLAKDGTIESIKHITKKHTKELREFVKEYLKSNNIDTFISTAGTPTTVSALKLGMRYSTYDYSKVNGSTIYKNDLQNTLSHLLTLSKSQKEDLVGVNRDDLIITGIIILEEIFDILGFDSSIVVDDGLREGVAISECISEV